MREVPSLILTILSFLVASSSADADEVPLPTGRVVGGLVMDVGRSVVVVTEETGLQPRTSFIVSGGDATQTVPVAGKSVVALGDGRFVLWGYKSVDGVSMFVHQVYRVRGTGKVALEEELVDRWGENSWIRVSPDGRRWVAMANLYTDSRDYLRTLGRQFAVGSMKSEDIRRSDAVAFYEARYLDHDIIAFRILDPEGPVVLAAYAKEVFLIRFYDGGVRSRAVEQLRWAVNPRGGDLDVVWQFGERLLWVRRGDEWLGYDLWNVDYNNEFPDEPFRRARGEGRPHPIRGFVEISRDGGRYRVKHSWQSPRFEEWREVHVSEWRDGSLPIAVSANGRYALVLESVRSEEGASATYARRFGLDLAPDLPPIEALPVEGEGQPEAEAKAEP